MRTVIAFFLVIFFSVSDANADAWTTAELGLQGQNTRENCMRRAETALSQVSNWYGGLDVYRDDWIVYIYDVGPEGADAYIMCPLVDDFGQVLAFVTVHTTGDTAASDRVTDDIQQAWYQTAGAGNRKN